MHDGGTIFKGGGRQFTFSYTEQKKRLFVSAF